MLLNIKVCHAMMLIAHCSLLFAALQFVVITRYYASLRLAKNKQQCTLSTIQLRILGLLVEYENKSICAKKSTSLIN